MFLSALHRRPCLTATAAILVSLVALGPADAGFFEDLFGGHSAPEPAPAYNYEAPPVSHAFEAPREISRQRKRVVKDEKPLLQKTTDIWHDETLREGDAVMMKDGLHVYTGPSGERPAARDLPRIDRVDLPRKELALLISMDTTRNVAPIPDVSTETLKSGRSVAVAGMTVSGYKITDARGRSVRYVGP